jgi:hypothetical protein
MRRKPDRIVTWHKPPRNLRERIARDWIELRLQVLSWTGEWHIRWSQRRLARRRRRLARRRGTDA